MEEAGDGGSQSGFEDRGLAVGKRDGDFSQGFVRGALAGNGDEVGGAVWIFAQAEFEGAVGLFALMEELRLNLATLENGKNRAEVGKAPFHGELVFPIKLLFAGLARGIEKHRGFGAVQPEPDHSTATAGVRLVDGVFVGT